MSNFITLLNDGFVANCKLRQTPDFDLLQNIFLCHMDDL